LLPGSDQACIHSGGIVSEEFTLSPESISVPARQNRTGNNPMTMSKVIKAM
jgi:hypothetical protein